MAKNLQFAVSPVFELLAAMLRVTAHEQLLEDSSGASLDKPLKLNEWVEGKRSALSADTKKDLEIFFSYESFFGITLIKYAWDEGVYSDVPTFIESLQQITPDRLFSYFLQSGYSQQRPVDFTNLDEVKAYIDHSTFPDEEKWKTLYLFMHKDETKQKMIALIKNFYGQIESEIDGLITKQKKSIGSLKNYISEKGQEKFLERMSQQILQPVSENDVIILAPSVFVYDTVIAMVLENNKFFLYGISYFRFEENSLPNQEKIIKAIKAISDDSRFSMIQLLSQRPLYGYELCKRLNLSSSTVSHHLTILVDIGIVKSVRKENKVYYKVNKSEIEKLLNQVKDLLI